MSLKTPEEFGQEYWSKSFEVRFETWADFLARRLDISKGETEEKILGVRTLPLIDAERKASPRFEAAARLLYEASPPCPHHHRKHGPTLASNSLILKLSGANCFGQERSWYRLFKKAGKNGLMPYRNVRELIIRQRLSESNPNFNNNSSAEMFSLHDIKCGVRWPKLTEESAIRCTSYVYGDGNLRAVTNSLSLLGRKVDQELYKVIQIDFDEAFNLWEKIKPDDWEETSQIIKGSSVKFDEFSRPTLEYKSKAMCKWLIGLGVPSRGEEKHLPPQLFNQSNNIKREFVKGLIATGSYFDYDFDYGKIWFSDRSKSIIEDYDKLLTDIGIECSSSHKPHLDVRTHCLTIYPDSTRKLWEQDHCSLNPYLQSKMDEFYLSKR
jgi:hypothetical protein